MNGTKLNSTLTQERCKTNLNNKVPLEMRLELKDSLKSYKEMPKLNWEMCLLTQAKLNHIHTKEMHHFLEISLAVK